MKKFFRVLSTFSLIISSLFFIGCAAISYEFPDIYNITENSNIVLSGPVPLTIKPSSEKNGIGVLNNNQINKCRHGNLTLLNFIPIKPVEIDIINENEVIPCGTPFGVKIFTDGVMVIGTSTVPTQNGLCNPAKQSGIKKGDVITQINNISIKSNEDLANVVENSEGNTLNVSVTRGNIIFDTSLTPVKAVNEDCYKIGIWVRDSSAGIGTVTFYNPINKSFSGLGHGICDVDTGEILPLSRGDIMEATVNGISKGIRGTPGELKGYFVKNKPIGKLYANTETGVYGTLTSPPCEQKAIKIAMKHQVKTGPAQVLTTILGEQPKYYNINIESINYNENNPTKNILISITDKELLEKTGGIVQGMSGSPIIQNNTLVGAVTHVFINEPNKGYAIFSETMSTNCNEIFSLSSRNVS